MNRINVNRGPAPQRKVGATGLMGMKKPNFSAALQDINSLISEYEELKAPTPSDALLMSTKLEKAFKANDLNLLKSYSNMHKDLFVQLLNTSHTNSLLHRACKSGNSEAVLIFLKAGANPNLANKSERTPMHKSYQFKEIVKILIGFNGKVNAKDKNGASPMHRAAYKGRIEVMRELVENGADLHARDFNLVMPVEMVADERIRNQLEKLFAWKKAKAPLFVYELTVLRKIPENLYRYMINFL